MWNNTVSVRHPSLWTFIRCLKDQQSSLETSIDAVNRGDAAPKRKRKVGEFGGEIIETEGGVCQRY